MNIRDRLAADPHSQDFFEVLRRLECENPDLPRMCKSSRVAEDFIRLRQERTLEF